MNTTIDLKTAKTIEAMNQKINHMGEKIYCESLRLIVAAWEGKPDSFRASVLRGVMHFVELYARTPDHPAGGV